MCEVIHFPATLSLWWLGLICSECSIIVDRWWSHEYHDITFVRAWCHLQWLLVPTDAVSCGALGANLLPTLSDRTGKQKLLATITVRP
jgi:hypothetical protein